jgi:c-di-GMP-binding flagellar brake protein YcgR
VSKEKVVIRERCRRIPVEISCWLEGEDDTSCIPTYDLSDTGVSVVCNDPLPEGRVVRLRFFTPLAAEAVTVAAEVVWSRTEPDGGMGLRFLNMDEKTMNVMRETIRLLRLREKAAHQLRETAE